MWEWFFLDFSRRAGWGGQSRSLIDVRSITCNGRRKWLFTTTAWFRFFNLAPRYDLWSPEAKLSPRGELSPLGVKLSPGGETLCSPLHSFEQWRVFTPGGERRGEHFPRGQSSPLGPSSLLGASFTPVGKLMLLKSGLWPRLSPSCSVLKSHFAKFVFKRFQNDPFSASFL
jgi:hypothetical protein